MPLSLCAGTGSVKHLERAPFDASHGATGIAPRRTETMDRVPLEPRSKSANHVGDTGPLAQITNLVGMFTPTSRNAEGYNRESGTDSACWRSRCREAVLR